MVSLESIVENDVVASIPTVFGLASIGFANYFGAKALYDFVLRDFDGALGNCNAAIGFSIVAASFSAVGLALSVYRSYSGLHK